MAEDNTGGGPGRRLAINPEDALEVIQNADEPFLSTGDIGSELDASKPTVIDRLNTLEEEGKVASNTVGGNTPVWYLPYHKNRSLREYSEGDVPQAESAPRPDGSATGEVVQRVTETRQQVVQVMNHLENLEGEVARIRRDTEEEEEPPDTWGEKAEREARVAEYAATRTAVLFVLLFIGYAAVATTPEVPLPLPVFANLKGLVGFAAGLAGLTAISGIAWWALVSASVRFGLADRLEEFVDRVSRPGRS